MSGMGRSGFQGLIVAMLFLGPLLAAFIIYYGPRGLAPGGSTQKGELIQPTVTLPEAALPQPGGFTTAPDWLQRRWSLLLYSPSACNTPCDEAVDRLRRVWQLLNREQIRVQRVLVTADGALGPDGDDELIVAWADAGPLSTTLAAASNVGSQIFIVDPLGNLVLRYPIDGPPKDVLSDMKKLLKLSRIG